VLILPDKTNEAEILEFRRFSTSTKIIPTGKMGPAQKRDIGAKNSNGEILAFLDDDAYPRQDWLLNVVQSFQNEQIGAVGGPAVTPKNDPLFAKISGAVFTSYLGGGGFRYRYWPVKGSFYVDDFPSVNLMVRRDLFEKIGGFDTNFWPGEDTKLCVDILNSGKKILYNPKVLVWHHRRNSFKSHLCQIWNYAMHRGFFVKKYPKTSLKVAYFVPSLFVFFLIFGYLFAGWGHSRLYYSVILLIYLFSLFISGIIEGIRIRSFWIGVFVIPAIFITHLTYGFGFIWGLVGKSLKM
jgi:GT2 family glycosyltransferase